MGIIGDAIFSIMSSDPLVFCQIMLRILINGEPYEYNAPDMGGNSSSNVGGGGRGHMPRQAWKGRWAGGGGGDSNTFCPFFKKFGLILQTRGRGILA